MLTFRSKVRRLGLTLANRQQTIERVISGDVAAFEDIVHSYSDHVFRIVANMVSSQDVEEVAQEVFIRVFTDLTGYRKSAPFEHWLSRVTVRTCYDYWRRYRRQRVVPVSDDQLQLLEQEAAQLDRSDTAAVERAKELLDWALGHLKPQDRLAFSLLYLEEMSMKELGEMLGWSVAQVKIRSFRARQALRKQLTAKLEKQDNDSTQ